MHTNDRRRMPHTTGGRDYFAFIQCYSKLAGGQTGQFIKHRAQLLRRRMVAAEEWCSCAACFMGLKPHALMTSRVCAARRSDRTPARVHSTAAVPSGGNTFRPKMKKGAINIIPF